MNWYLRVIKKYAVFSGRARRKEYWIFMLLNFIIGLVLALIDSMIFGQRDIGILGSLYSLAMIIPSIAVSVRRLHDTGRSGGWLFINLVPLIGWIVFLIFTLIDSQPGDNKYGPNPKNETV